MRLFDFIVPRGFVCAKGPDHLLLDPLNGAGANAARHGGLQDARAFAQMTQDSPLCRGVDLGPAELFALLYGPLKPGIDSLADHAALELGEGARHLKHQLAGGCRGVDRLLIEVQIDAAGL